MATAGHRRTASHLNLSSLVTAWYPVVPLATTYPVSTSVPRYPLGTPSALKRPPRAHPACCARRSSRPRVHAPCEPRAAGTNAVVAQALLNAEVEELRLIEIPNKCVASPPRLACRRAIPFRANERRGAFCKPRRRHFGRRVASLPLAPGSVGTLGWPALLG